MATPRTSGGFDINTNHQSRYNLYGRATRSGIGKKSDDDDDDDNNDTHNITSNTIISGGGQKERLRSRVSWSSLRQSTEQNASLLSGLSFATLCFRSAAFATITLYVLNQNHMLPKPLGMFTSRLLFWPTIPITVSKRIGKWTTVVDNAVVLGGAPFGFMKYPEKLRELGVRGVINMCEEYHGPAKSYERLGIEHLRLPTVDHFEPSVEDLKRAVSFIQKHEAMGDRVYVHCRAGHGRSAAAVYAWLLYKEPLADPVELNEKLCALRNVRKALHSQPNVITFRNWLQEGGMVSDSDDEGDIMWTKKHRQISTRSRAGYNTAHSPINRRFSESSPLGRVFSDEDLTEDDWSEEEGSYDDDYYDYSEDEF